MNKEIEQKLLEIKLVAQDFNEQVERITQEVKIIEKRLVDSNVGIAVKIAPDCQRLCFGKIEKRWGFYMGFDNKEIPFAKLSREERIYFYDNIPMILKVMEEEMIAINKRTKEGKDILKYSTIYQKEARE